MNISFSKKKGNYIFLGIMLALSVYGVIASASFFAPCAFWFVLLFLMTIPNYEIKGGASLALDILFPVFGGAFTVYFTHLINIAGHSYFKGEDSLFRYIGHGTTEVFITLAPLVFFFYFFFRIFAIPRKVAAALMPFFPLLLALVDYYVYQFRGQEFMAADITGTTTAMNVADNYVFDLYKPFAFIVLPYILYICVCLRVKTDKSTSPWYLKTVANLMIASVMASSFVGLLYNYSERHQIFSWGDEGSRFNGFLLTFSLSVKLLIPEKPEGYVGDSYFEGYREELDVDTSDAANIIIVMNESYCDPDYFIEDMTADPDPFWDSLTEDRNTVSGIALSSVYGGRTPNSEFEMLTGITTGYLPAASIPYSMYVDDAMPSLPNYLRNLGYSTCAMHPYLSSGWNRTSAYPRLGFDDYIFLDDFEYDDSDLIRSYMSDMCAYENLIDHIESAPSGQKTFIFLVTMQNHGGYSESFSNFPITEYVTDLDDGWDFGVNNYISLVRESDRALEMLVNYLASQDEKYVLLIFGDHQPSIGHLGTDMGPGGDAWYIPYIIWSNYDMPDSVLEQEIRGDVTSLNYLAIDVLNAAGIDLPPYFEYIAEIRQTVPAINASGFYSPSTGAFQPLGNDLYTAEYDTLLRYRYLQYNVVFDDGRNSLTAAVLPADD
ncbi:MAG: LTA synthase family protein [Clostridiales bacterium]|nr:LTA synthase family protein [Clostridiales bacterium]